MKMSITSIQVVVESNLNGTNETPTLRLNINFLPLVFLPLKSKPLVVIIEPTINLMRYLLTVCPQLSVYFDEVDLDFEVGFLRDKNQTLRYIKLSVGMSILIP